MPTLRVLTVDLSDLNLETDVIDGACVEISIERAASFDSFVIVPSLDYKATSDNTGILTFNILPSDYNTRYRVSVTDSTGHQVLTGIFVMPDSNANIADLLDLSFFPDGFNSDPANGASVIQFKDNSTALGTPTSVRNVSFVNTGGLATYDPDTFTVSVNLQSIQDAITGLTTASVPDSTNHRYVTDAQRTVLTNTSGTNTGDETATSIRTKIGAASNSNDGYLSATDWSTFNGKQAALGFTPENVSNKDTDGTLSSNSDISYPSQKAVKTYADTPKTSAWSLSDGADATKKTTFNLSGIATATTRTVTMPDANVNLGNIPASYAVSGGVLTITNTNGGTTTLPVNNNVPLVLSPGLNLVSGHTYQCSDDNLSYGVNMPASPADGDFIIIRDTMAGQASRCTRTGVIQVSTSGSIWLGTPGYYQALSLPSATTGRNQRWSAKYVFSAQDSTWWGQPESFIAEPQYLNTYIKFYDVLSPSSGGVPTYGFQFSTSTLTGMRTIMVPDFNIDLSNINSVPVNNSRYGNSTTLGGIVVGSSNTVSKTNQVILFGTSVNADTALSEDMWVYGNRSTTYSSSRVTGCGGILKHATTGTASGVLVTGSNTNPPAYLTKPSGHDAIGIFEITLSMTTSAGKIWTGRRRVNVRWDGASATIDTQTIGTDYNPDTQSATVTASVVSGLLTLTVANASADGGDTCQWQCTYTAHYNGG